MKLRPINNRVVVKADQPKKKTEAGIFLPDTNDERKNIGIVQSVARGVKDVKKGDRIIFNHYAGSEVEVDGEKLNIIEVRDIYAIL